MLLQTTYWTFQNVLTEKECNDIITYSTNVKLEDAILFDEKNANKSKLDYSKRRTKVSWINDRELFEKLAGLIITANYNAGWNFSIDCGQDIQFGSYSTGDYFDWHCDQVPLPGTMDINDEFKNKTRKLTICVALNDKKDYDGGEFQICHGRPDEYQKDTCDIMFKKGNAIVFPSFLYHRVKKITNGTRYSLVMWGCGDPFR